MQKKTVNCRKGVRESTSPKYIAHLMYPLHTCKQTTLIRCGMFIAFLYFFVSDRFNNFTRHFQFLNAVSLQQLQIDKELVHVNCRHIHFFANLCIFVLFSFRYAIRDGNKIKIFKNFKERKSFKPEYGAESEYSDSISVRPIHPSAVIYMVHSSTCRSTV